MTVLSVDRLVGSYSTEAEDAGRLTEDPGATALIMPRCRPVGDHASLYLHNWSLNNEIQ